MKTKTSHEKSLAEIPCSAGKAEKTRKIKSFHYYREGDLHPPWNESENRRFALGVSSEENGLHRCQITLDRELHR